MMATNYTFRICLFEIQYFFFFPVVEQEPSKCLLGTPLQGTEISYCYRQLCLKREPVLFQWSGTPPPHVCFVTSSSVVIYGSHRDHFSGLFISGEDKRKSWLYCPGGVGLFTQRRASSGSCNIPASHISDLPFQKQ